MSATDNAVSSEEALARLAGECEDAHVYLREHEKNQCVYHHHRNLRQHIQAVIEEYRSQTVNALRAAKEFRDRMLVDLRALEMVLHMVSNASTHKEKDARLRGCIELIGGAFQRLEREQFEIAACNHPHFDDVFRSDYPTRHYVERIRDLERQLEGWQAAPPQKSQECEAPSEPLF
jgi:sugar phosphate isomerase/epimerase